jgi:hypothetical protein
MSELNENHTNEHQEFTQEAIRSQKILTGVSRTLDTAKVKHQGDRATAVHAIIAKLKADGIEFRVSDRNWIVPERNGQPINLQATVDHILLTDPSIGDRASVEANVAAGELTIEARSDLKTVAEKTSFINRFGYEKWSKLPINRVPPVNMDPLTMTNKDWNTLTVQQRIDFHKRADVDLKIFSAILSRK